MGLTSAMYSGVSGLMTYGDAMNVTGDNIANVNTIGFKGNATIFADVLANSVSNGATTMQFGRGALIQGVKASFAQGSFSTTGNATDMGIQGAGFFVVKDTVNSATYYTRAGQFIINNDGKLANPNDYLVQGYKLTTNASGVVTRANGGGDIDISGVQSTPKTTTMYRMGLNLSSVASAGTTFSTSMNVYNSLGEEATITYTFTKTSTALQWQYNTSGPTGTSLSGTGSSGTLTFSSAGVLSTRGAYNGSGQAAITADLPLVISGFPSGASSLTVSWDLYNTAASSQRNEITGYASNSVTNSMWQDGYSTGVLRGLSVDQEGIISGLFSNGQTQKMYQVQMADFISPWGLSRQGNTLFAETTDSGQPILGFAKSGGFGTIYGSSLELSSVDLSREFVDMIQNQRAYQANSRIITTVDQMLQDVIALKR
ncbi:Flagellar hook protein FlgE [hydrothermal vent metagenome]|uniref:Flagellar hook protein FlgE n=1 Tax=hydrothermal vent metagenome TaxID=652676 RepID=A0A3B1C5P6_9ZZZZ